MHPAPFGSGRAGRAITALIASSLVCFTTAHAEDPLPSADRLQSSPVLRHLRPNPVAGTPRSGPEETVARMHVPEGFRVDLVTGEPELHQPVAFAWDERGRIWVAEAYSYPTRRAEGQGLDKLVIFEDRDRDGRFESRKVFAEGLNLVSGFEVGHGGVWVGAAPQLLFIPDRNHDDVPDGPPQVLLEGFGFQDTHECLNSFLWGPDGWLYGNQGVFNYSRIGKPGAADSNRTELRAGVWRYHPVRHEFEVFAHGGSNPWGLDFDEKGQLFMTHCRSYWGRGCTTHVVQGGHFWNQANANYAPFIIAEPPGEFPGYRNFLLASARYDHGAGGAGKPGSDAIYGGHSHVGTMIYLGDNWPEEFRGHLFTHNLGGHQMNQQVNRPLGSGYDTVHAGRDQLFCTDPKYVAVDLQYGPDGAVYFIDWYDQQHCHNPNTERWDRSNGRLYRMSWQASYKPISVDLASKTDSELVALLSHRNAWYGRTAKRLLDERSHAAKGIDRAARRQIVELAAKGATPASRLMGLWTALEVGEFSDRVARRALSDPDEHVRAWAVQLSTDSRKPSLAMQSEFARLAVTDPSPVVRRYLASAIQRVPDRAAWDLIRALARHAEDREDRHLPLLLWQGLAQRMPSNLDAAFEVASTTPLANVADYIHWYAGTFDGAPLNRTVAALETLDGEPLRRRLAGLWLALEPRANVPMPPAWSRVATKLRASSDAAVGRLTDRVAAAFGDSSAFPRLRQVLADRSADVEGRKHAFAVLNRAQDPASIDTLLGLLDDPAFRTRAIQMLARFDAPSISRALLEGFAGFPPADQAAVLAALTSRVSYASALLDAVAEGRVKRNQMGAFQVRQLAALKDPAIDARVASTWGRIGQSPAEKQSLIQRMEKVFNEAPLWAYDGRAGRGHFQRLCASCHVLGPDGNRIGPELSGAGKHGIRYFLENVIDPNAVIGSDFQMTSIETKKGDVISGLVLSETASAVTVRTVAEQMVVPKSDIATRSTSDRSLMPEGLLESLGDREQIELLKYLTSN